MQSTLLRKRLNENNADGLALSIVRAWGRGLAEVTPWAETDLFLARTLITILVGIRRTIANGELSPKELVRLAQAGVNISRQISKIQRRLGGPVRRREPIPNFENILEAAAKRMARRQATEGEGNQE